MISLHGLSGLDKTTLVKEVANEAFDEKMFDAVTMASIIRNLDIYEKSKGILLTRLGYIE